MIDDSDLIWIRNARNLPKIKTHILPKLCDRPWNGMSIDRKGRIFICHCEGWLPFSVGHILEFESIEEVYNSSAAKCIQETILNGTYEFCDTVHCPVTHPIVDTINDKVEYDYYIEFGIDESCNLKCPSCRPNIIFHDNNHIYDERLKWIGQLNKWINKSPDKRFKIMIGGNGEPFASPIYLKFFENNFQANVIYNIRTNATLVKRHIDNLKILPNLKRVEVSIDAASREIYEQVRQPAKWKTLQENIDYLITLRQKYNFYFVGNFVIQRANLDDVLPFVKWCRERNIIPCFTILQNWASFPNFDLECVHRPQDANYQKFLSIIKTSEFRTTNMGWLVNYD